MSLSRRYVVLGVLALLALQFFWQAFLLPPERASGVLVAVLLSLPLLPSLLLFLARRPSATFWAGVASLFYFCHGVTEAWTVPPARPVALSEAALAVWVVVASSWEGLKARRTKRNTPPANV